MSQPTNFHLFLFYIGNFVCKLFFDKDILEATYFFKDASLIKYLSSSIHL